MVMDFVMEKQRFWDVFCPQTVKKSDFSYEKGMKTYDFLKIQLLCELMQKESA